MQSEDTKIFIKKAIKIHGDKYSYENVEYKNSATKVWIFCRELGHGLFDQRPAHHLSGKGCPKCGNKSRSTTQKKPQETFIEDCRRHWGNRYGYDKVKYVNRETDVEIYCFDHKKYFSQKPLNHLNGRGCPDCGSESKIYKLRSNTEEFVKKAKIVWAGYSYNYEEVKYVDSKTKVAIVCEEHNRIFRQTPQDHLAGSNGCKDCAKNVQNQDD
jgi:Zn finger protein HypA/HybF involved in hydrogenase expression